MEEKLKAEVEFAGEVVGLAMDSSYDTTAVMNGIAIGTAALLVDLSLKGDGSINTEQLDADTRQFKNTLLAAVGFAQRQVEAGAVE